MDWTDITSVFWFALFAVVAILAAFASLFDGAWWSLILAAGGILGLYLAGSKNLWGWVVSFAMQGAWIIYALVTEQYGFIFSAVAYGWVYARNFIKWRNEQNKEVTA